jgi:hypothetical protein
MDLVLSGRSIPYTVNALDAVPVGHSLVLFSKYPPALMTLLAHCSNLFSGVLNKGNFGNLGISVILLSALRVSGSGVNFLRVWVLFYCFCCYF